MADQLRQRLQNQAKVQVARQSQDNLAGFWFGALAAFAAGVFYFWYYWFTSGSVLIGP
jgi:hypothetical protein